MTTEIETLRESLRVLVNSPQPGLPLYAADPVVRRRVGRMLAAAAKPVHPAGDENW
jgi:hypothetical protein